MRQDTWPFQANDPVQLLERVCQVLGGLDDSAVDAAKGVVVENQIAEFAPEVRSLLHQVAKRLVGTDIARRAALPGPPGGPAKRALVAIHE